MLGPILENKIIPPTHGKKILDLRMLDCVKNTMLIFLKRGGSEKVFFSIFYFTHLTLSSKYAKIHNSITPL